MQTGTLYVIGPSLLLDWVRVFLQQLYGDAFGCQEADEIVTFAVDVPYPSVEQVNQLNAFMASCFWPVSWSWYAWDACRPYDIAI